MQTFSVLAIIIAICSLVSTRSGPKTPFSIPPIMPASYAAVISASVQSSKGLSCMACGRCPVTASRKSTAILPNSCRVIWLFAFCRLSSGKNPASYAISIDCAAHSSALVSTAPNAGRVIARLSSPAMTKLEKRFIVSSFPLPQPHSNRFPKSVSFV